MGLIRAIIMSNERSENSYIGIAAFFLGKSLKMLL